MKIFSRFRNPYGIVILISAEFYDKWLFYLEQLYFWLTIHHKDKQKSTFSQSFLRSRL